MENKTEKIMDYKQYLFIIHYKNGNLKVVKLPYENVNTKTYYQTIHECLFNKEVKSYEYFLGIDCKREDDSIMRELCLNWID
jgi:hypothetical protein